MKFRKFLRRKIGQTIHDATESLRVRDYRLFYFGQFMSFTGTWMRRTALGWLVFEITGEYHDLGTVFGLMTLPLLIFSTWAGSLADQFPKKKMILITQAIAGFLSFLLAMLVWSDAITVELIYIFAILSGTAFAFEVPARQSYFKELVGKEKLANAIALNSALINLTRILGPALAGFLMYIISESTGGKSLVFLIDALSYVVVVIMLLKVRTAGNPQLSVAQERGSRIIQGLTVVAATPLISKTLVMLFFMGVLGWSFQTLLPGIVQEQLKLEEIWFGFLMAAFGVGASVSALLVAAGSRKLNPAITMISGLAMMGFSLLLLSFSLNFNESSNSGIIWIAGSLPYTLMVLFIIPAGFGAVMFLSMANSMVQTSIGDDVRGRVMGIWALSFGGSLPLGSFLAGIVADLEFMGPMRTIFYSNVTMLAILAILSVRMLRNHRHQMITQN